MNGITVIVTGGVTYAVPNAVPASTRWVVGPTGELAVEAYGQPAGEDPEWLASFGSVEVVGKDGEVFDVTATEETKPAAKSTWP